VKQTIITGCAAEVSRQAWGVRRLTRQFHACDYTCTCIAHYVVSMLFHRHPRLDLFLALEQVDPPHITLRRSCLGFGLTMASLHKNSTGC
jgi:hypothetical protein